MSERTFVIIGASLAGAKVAAELRSQGFDGQVMLIGSESKGVRSFRASYQRLLDCIAGKLGDVSA